MSLPLEARCLLVAALRPLGTAATHESLALHRRITTYLAQQDQLDDQANGDAPVLGGLEPAPVAPPRRAKGDGR